MYFSICDAYHKIIDRHIVHQHQIGNTQSVHDHGLLLSSLRCAHYCYYCYCFEIEIEIEKEIEIRLVIMRIMVVCVCVCV